MTNPLFTEHESLVGRRVIISKPIACAADMTFRANRTGIVQVQMFDEVEQRFDYLVKLDNLEFYCASWCARSEFSLVGA